MVKYLGPKFKKIRSLGILKGFYNKRIYAKRLKTPGEHSTNILMGLKSFNISKDFKKNLMSNQKIRYTYGISKKAFTKMYLKQQKDVNLLIGKLKTRLDYKIYIKYKLKTIRQARFYINHGRVVVNQVITKCPGRFMKNTDNYVLV